MFAFLCSLGALLPFGHVLSLHLSQTPRQVGHRQSIVIGRPFDVLDDIYRDIAIDQHNTPMGDRMKATENIHFFTPADCWIFASRERCNEARKSNTYLASYPGSGNTWTRYIFEKTLSIYTGSVFCDEDLKKKGMAGECIEDPRRVFLVKTHWPVFGRHSKKDGVKTLVIVRDPLHAALSLTTLWNKVVPGTGEHNNVVPKEMLEQKFDEHVREYLKNWKIMAETIRNYEGSIQVVRYEDIVANPSNMYLQEMFPYVGVDSSNSRIIERLSSAIQSSADAHFKRNHTYVFEFTDSHRELVRELVGEDLAKHYGYEV